MPQIDASKLPFRARIKPDSLVENYDKFQKSKGWYAVDADKAEWLRERRMNTLNPNSPLVFDVQEAKAAKEIAAKEAEKATPAGTPEAPIVLPPEKSDERPTKAEKSKPEKGDEKKLETK